MDIDILQRHFDRIGARLAVSPSPTLDVQINIRSDRRGEFFAVRAGPLTDLSVVDLRPDMRHLLLMARLADGRRAGRKDKFLCGHDERAWFVAGVPDDRGISNVRTAMEALKPDFVREAQARARIRPKDLARRRTTAYVRQGEWFFVPAPDLVVGDSIVLHDEPLRRGFGKPHWAEFLTRTGGELVYVGLRAPDGLTESQRHDLFRRDPQARKASWVAMRRNPDVYVRGRITHPDHATVILPVWHRVNMNTEWRAASMRHVTFLD